MMLGVIIAVYCISTSAAQNTAQNTVDRANAELAQFDEERLSAHAEQMFKRLYIKRRAEQLDAVKGLLNLASYEKQYKMIDVIVDKVFSVLQSSRVVLEGSGYVPGISTFPTDEKVRDALANILENTALFGDILLHLPDISHRVLSSKHEWQVILQWSLGFTNQSQLIDKQTRVLVDLVNMELNLTERHPNYVNPYKRDPHPLSRLKEEVKTVNSSKKKKEIKRGPRMSRVEL